jgi:hypothetical protein
MERKAKDQARQEEDMNEAHLDPVFARFGSRSLVAPHVHGIIAPTASQHD